MASGLPDYFRSVRPRYGGAQKCWGTKTLIANSENILCDIAGKGMIYGGNLSFDGVMLDKWYVANLYVDSVIFYAVNFRTLYLYQHLPPGSNPVFLQKYNESDGLYSIGVSSGYTFESSFKFSITENQGHTPDVYYNIFYALIA